MKHFKSLLPLAITAVVGMSLTACGGSPSATATAPNVEPLGVQTTTAPTKPEIKKSTRGNIVKEPGQPAGIADQNGEQIVNFTINSITTGASCTGPYPQPAENGHLTVLDVTVETMPELANTPNGPSSFDINAAMFKFVGTSGTTFNGSLGTMGAYSCLPDEETIGNNGAGIGPGEKVTGKLVLDLPETAGILVFQSYLTSGNGGWEYTF